MKMAPELKRICEVSELEPGSIKRVEVEGLPPLAVYKLDTEIFITDDICTHGQASLSEGFLEGDVVECPIHGGCFSIRTGEALSFPATLPVRTYKARVVGAEVFLEITA
ncbi:MAG: non-heme iron oxygenase ferredoxin subunit [Candidatus Binataceae bacterium]|nr:non-heme iron oxygenase ferredoxin subunit [Candidatus Binataceae bacterium]